MTTLEKVSILLAERSAEVRDELSRFEKSVSDLFAKEVSDAFESGQERESVRGTMTPIQILAAEKTSFSLTLLSKDRMQYRYRKCLQKIHPRKEGDPVNTELLQVLRAAYRNDEQEVLLSIFMRVNGWAPEDENILEKAVHRAQGRLHRLKASLVEPILSPYYGGRVDEAATKYVNALRSLRLRIESKVLRYDHSLSDATDGGS